MSQSVSILLCGAAGKMGKEAVKAIQARPDLQLAAAVTHRSGLGIDAGSYAGSGEIGVVLHADFAAALAALPAPAVLVDLSRGEPAFEHAQKALARAIPVVIGATGLSPEQLQQLEDQARARATGVLIAPNFSIGALLLMNFAHEAARYFNWVEIIELHHEKKADSPSGTAIKTAALIAEANTSLQSANSDQAARGQQVQGIPVHSVRLPGLLAHQEVIFGDQGQTLTLRHDTLDRSCFMPGLLLAIEKVQALRELVYGLEKLL